MKSLFTGLGVAVITPFHNGGRIDWVALEWLVNHLISEGVDFLVPMGTTGESPTTNHDEHIAVVDFVVEKTARRVPVLAGTGSNSTEEAVDLTRRAKEVGADGALVVMPYYNKPTVNGLMTHYRRVAEVGLPVVLYDIPGRCGGQMMPARTIVQLANEGVICGLKWASGNMDQLMDVLRAAPEEFSVLSGDDNLTFILMSLGGHGSISVLGNLLPAETRRVINGALDESRKAHFELLEIMRAMFIETNPLPIKTALSLAHPDIFQADFRLPLCEMEIESLRKLQSVLRDYGLLPA